MLTSRFLRYAIPLGAVLALTLSLVYWQAAKRRQAELQQTEEKYVALLSEALADDFLAVITDLMVLDSVAFRSADLAGGTSDPAQAAARDVDRRRLAESFRRFVEKKRVYDQIRFLDLNGMEVVRVNYHDDDARGEIVPDEHLQLKQDRYYFHEAMRLDAGQVFVSPFDLNVEDGKIETPEKPTIRFAMRVTDSANHLRGILVLNYLGREMLNRFARLDADSPGHCMLINSAGYWLYDGHSAREWAFMHPQQSHVCLPQTDPLLWQNLTTRQRGTLSTSQGLFTFSAVQPFQFDRRLNVTINGTGPSSGTDRRWYVVSQVSKASLASHLAGLRQTMSTAALVLMTIVLGISAVLAKYATEREQSRQALHVSESRFRQMADSIAEVFWMTNVDRSRFIYVSPAFAKIWGRRIDRIDDALLLWENAIHPDDREQVVRARNNAISAEGFSLQYRIVRPDGAQRWIWDQGFAVRDEVQRVTGFAGIAEDITDLKETQRQLLQNVRLAAVGEAITGLAHESRNALQRSTSCLEMLAKRVADRPEANDLVQRTQLALRDLHYLYERVRTYAAPIQLEISDCDLRHIWDQTCEDLNEMIRMRGALFTSDAHMAQTRVRADSSALRQVFRNILENALAPELDAMSNRIQVKIHAVWRDVELNEGRGLEVTIRDNGPGFSDGNCERIFEPFFTTEARGTGLGLSICRPIM